MAVGYTVGWGRKVRQGRMWLAVVGEGSTAITTSYPVAPYKDATAPRWCTCHKRCVVG